jgi:hypothetical protein
VVVLRLADESRGGRIEDLEPRLVSVSRIASHASRHGRGRFARANGGAGKTLCQRRRRRGRDDEQDNERTEVLHGPIETSSVPDTAFPRLSCVEPLGAAVDAVSSHVPRPRRETACFPALIVKDRLICVRQDGHPVSRGQDGNSSSARLDD